MFVFIHLSYVMLFVSSYSIMPYVNSIPVFLVFILIEFGWFDEPFKQEKLSASLQETKEEKIVLTGFGPTVSKTITCAEIIKRRKQVCAQLMHLF